MRVVSGRYRGKTLIGPKTDAIRPTADKVKEAVFNILGDKIVGARWLEPFGGSGGMGIEALSRGAASATFIDSAKEAYRLIRQNLDRVGATGGEVLYGDWAVVLKRLEAEGKTFDLIYLDPPYASDYGRVLDYLSGSALTAAGCRILVEYEREEPACPERFVVCDRRRYGRIRIATLIKKGGCDEDLRVSGNV